MSLEPRVLYEDNHLLIAEKQPGMPSQEDSSGDLDTLSALKAYVKRTYNKPGEAWLGLVHRLDRPAGGVMAFARTSKAAARLAEQMKDGRFRKEYLCVCVGEARSARLEHWLTKDERTNTVTATVEQRPGSLWAALEVAPMHTREGLTLCRVNLLTGRPHQIRVQMAAIGHSLWGDQRYNPEAKPGQWLALWSTRLTLEHPTRRETMSFTSLPQGGIWARFEPGLFTGEDGNG